MRQRMGLHSRGPAMYPSTWPATYKRPFGARETFRKHPKRKNRSFANITEKSDCSVCVSLGKLRNVSSANSCLTERTAQSCSFDRFATSPPSLARSRCGRGKRIWFVREVSFELQKKPCSLCNGAQKNGCTILLRNISWVPNGL